MSHRYFAAVIILMLFSVQCAREHSEMDILLNLPMKEQEENFKKFPLSKQVDVYIQAMYVEPPQTRYADYLASNGKQVLQFLIDRLKQEKSDTAKAFLFFAFEVMHEKYYSLSKEKEVLESLKTTSIGMSDNYRRKQAEGYLKTILEQPGAQ
jgi:hypothetical protein